MSMKELIPRHVTVMPLSSLAAVTRNSEYTLVDELSGNTWISNPKPGSFRNVNVVPTLEANIAPVNLLPDSRVTTHSAVSPACSQENTTWFPTHTGSPGGVSWAPSGQ